MFPVLMTQSKWNRAVLPVLAAGVLFLPAATFGAGQKFERHFAVKGRPVVSIQNVANGRIEVKAAPRTQEVIVTGSQLSNKIGVESEQADSIALQIKEVGERCGEGGGVLRFGVTR